MRNTPSPRSSDLGLELLEGRRHLSLTVKLDYTYDTHGFFAQQGRRDAMQAAVNSVTARINDRFAEIRPGDGNSWVAEFGHPSEDGVVRINNPVVPADTMIVYPGSTSLGPSTLATLARSHMDNRAGSTAWKKLLDTRGRTEPANGLVTAAIATIEINPDFPWYGGAKIDGIKPGEYDLYSVAVHEFGHILGLGGSLPWTRQLSADGGTFNGPASAAAYGGPVPAEFYHWADHVRIDGTPASMTPQPPGVRKEFTRLDFAALKDVGYDVTLPPPVTGTFGSVDGYTYDDRNGNGRADAGEAVADTLVVLDADDDGVFDPGELYAASNAQGYYTINSVPAGGYSVLALNVDNSHVLAAYKRVRVNVTADTRVRLPDLRLVASTPRNLSGMIFDDANANGSREGEPGRAGVTVYLDDNNNGVVDEDERRTVTSGGGFFGFSNIRDGQYRVRVVTPADSMRTTPESVTVVGQNDFAVYIGIARRGSPPAETAALRGVTFNDNDKNGRYNAGDTVAGGKTVFLDANGSGTLDAGERSVVSGNDGSWAFTGLAAGVYRVRRVFPSGYVYSTTPIDVTLAAGQTAAGLAIGSKPGAVTPPQTNTASISGVAFNDSNKNGKYDAGDSVAGGKTMWIDVDDDGVKDANEVSVVTAADGSFTFKNLAAGTYHVRRVFPAGYVESTPARYLTLASGQVATGVLIGSKAK